MTGPAGLRAAGTSAAAIRHHYDLSDDFFGTWLGPELVYSCALWLPGEGPGALATAQRRKLDHFADRLAAPGARVLDVGCGWGALLARLVERGAAGGVGLTLSPVQARFATARGVPGAAYRVESWVDHNPDEPYDAVACVEATEHFASDALDPDQKVEVYRAFFDRVASWLRPGGRVGLQLICLDNVGHERSRPGRGPFSELISREIFPESMCASLSELVLGWETEFQLTELVDHSDHYRRTFRAWNLAFRAQRERARDLVGEEVVRTFERYFAAGEACFRLREESLHRVLLTKRPAPKSWAVPVRPSDLAATPAPSASPAAVRSHYDVSNDFYRLWLGPTMMYSSAMWLPADPVDGLDRAQHRKIDFFAERTGARGAAQVLDVGCGWGGTLRRLLHAHEVGSAVGLTLSPAQRGYTAATTDDRAEARLEPWAEHRPDRPYDAVFSFGAFEHFARDGSTGPERVAAYRQFFAACHDWLVPGGRLALETIAHDDAPDTAAPKGRGPLGDFVLELFPESVCPHLSEVVLGFEPHFELEVLRSDADDFARTCRRWLVGLRTHEAEAEALVGAEVTSRFRRYLAASELQFRTRSVTNYRIVLKRRPAPRV
ncbi:MAG: class I SAM-dependent methyltransferase [Nocardioidaceae bacterium]